MFPSTDPCLWVTVHLHKAIAVGGGKSSFALALSMCVTAQFHLE